MRPGDERGVATVTLILLLPILLVFLVFSVDAANWFVHKRHLQTQADAAALAGAGNYRFPTCDDGLITSAALTYSGKGSGGTAYNATLPTIAPSRLHAVVNGPNYFGQAKPNEGDLAGSPTPCTAKVVDVKMTETDLPWFFGTGLVPHVNAQARVKLFTAATGDGLNPLAVQEASPDKVRAYIVDEATGTPVKDAAGKDVSVLLSAHGASGGLQQFDNESAPLAFTPPAGVTNLGVRLALSGATSTTCGDELVTCYDSVATTNGLTYLRAWTNANDPTTGQAPVVRSARVAPAGGAGTCTGGSLTTSATACKVAVTTQLKWAPVVTAADLGTKTKVTAKVAGVSYPMTYSGGTWTAASVSIPSGTIGPRTVDVDWEQQVGVVAGNTCSTSGGNKCKGTITGVQRVFWNDPTDQSSRGGPVGRLEVLNSATALPVSDLQRCSATYTACTTNLTFQVGISGSLALAAATDPPVALRVKSGSQTQAVDCDPTRDFIDSVAYGCSPPYKINTGTSCASPTTPLSCVPVETGTFSNKPAAGFNIRFLCQPAGNPGKCKGSAFNWDGKPSTCPPAGAFGHNNWPNYPPGDPRVVAVFVTPFGTFQGSGNAKVPIVDFAAFYVTGYASSGNGFDNPCLGSGDQFAPGTAGDNGVVSGHFIKNVNPNTGTPSTDTCDFNDIGQCVAVLVK